MEQLTLEVPAVACTSQGRARGSIASSATGLKLTDLLQVTRQSFGGSASLVRSSLQLCCIVTWSTSVSSVNLGLLSACARGHVSFYSVNKLIACWWMDGPCYSLWGHRAISINGI